MHIRRPRTSQLLPATSTRNDAEWQGSRDRQHRDDERPKDLRSHAAEEVARHAVVQQVPPVERQPWPQHNLDVLADHREDGGQRGAGKLFLARNALPHEGLLALDLDPAFGEQKIVESALGHVHARRAVAVHRERRTVGARARPEQPHQRVLNFS